VRRTLVVFALLLPASLLGAGHDVSTVRYVPVHAYDASIAFNGEHFLTLWRESPHINGVLLDPSNGNTPRAFPVVPFANASAMQLRPAGDGYVAIWNQVNTPSLGILTSLGALERRVALDAGALTAPRMAFNGSRILVADWSNGAAATIDVSLYDLNGALVRRLPLPVSMTNDYGSQAYAVTENGGEFAIVTAGISGINEWRVADDGTIVSKFQIQAPPPYPVWSEYQVAIASKGGRIAIAWRQIPSRRPSFAVIQANGSVARLEIPSVGDGPSNSLAILPVDTGFVLVGDIQTAPEVLSVFALRIDTNGSLLDAVPVMLGDGGFMAAASSADAVAIIVRTPPIYSLHTLLASVNASGISPYVATPTAITSVIQSSPVVTGNGVGFTAAWTEQWAGYYSVAAGRVSRDGEPLDSAGVALVQKKVVMPASAIAHSSSEALIIWAADMFAARLTPFGDLLDASPIPINRQYGITSLAVAWNGSRYFIVWTDTGRLYGEFIGPDGVCYGRETDKQTARLHRVARCGLGRTSVHRGLHRGHHSLELPLRSSASRSC